MPNIEIHGYPFDLPERAEEDLGLRLKIWDALSGMKDLDQVVITSVGSQVEDKGKERQPFLRLLWTPETKQEEVDEIERRLDTIFPPIDVEFMQLAKFKPKRILTQEEALETLKSLRPVAGTDKDFDYEKDKLLD